jgi:hypothetical protein
LSNSHLPISAKSPVDSIPYKALHYTSDVIEQLKNEIKFVESKIHELQNSHNFENLTQESIEAKFYKKLEKIEMESGEKACLVGESNLWKELQFLLRNDSMQASDHWMSFHLISEFRDSIHNPETRSTEQIVAEYESKLGFLLQTWQDYTGSAYPL